MGRMFGGKSWPLGVWCLFCRFFGKLQKQLLVVGDMPGHGDCSRVCGDGSPKRWGRSLPLQV